MEFYVVIKSFIKYHNLLVMNAQKHKSIATK